MRLQLFYKYLMIVCLSFLYSCASKPKGELGLSLDDSPGVWIGIWHGFILPFSLLGKIFQLNIGIHETINSGTLYWIGFLIGFGLLVRAIMFLDLVITEDKKLN